MTVKTWHVLVFVGVAIASAPSVIRFFTDQSSMKCVAIRDNPSWSFRSFINRCDKRIYVRFCDKSQVGELASLFGVQNVGGWRCRLESHDPGGNIATIKWVNEQSSVASHALASSRYNITACYWPYHPEHTQEGKFTCKR